MFQPTQQHLDIRDALLSGSNIIVEASAGSGKTSTILWLQDQLAIHAIQTDSLLPPAVLFLAFNKTICDELKTRVLQGTTVSTFHSLGLAALRAAKVVSYSPTLIDARKCAKLLYNMMAKDHADFQNVLRLVSLLKSQIGESNIESAEKLSRQHDLSFEDFKSKQLALKVLDYSNNDLKSIDFDDMLYLAIRHNCEFNQVDFIFVDEAQDTNDIQLEICELISTVKTSFVFVGDPHQAIYGFRGANADSMSRIAARFACESFPLDVSYRCSRAVVKEAQRVLKQEI